LNLWRSRLSKIFAPSKPANRSNDRDVTHHLMWQHHDDFFFRRGKVVAFLFHDTLNKFIPTANAIPPMRFPLADKIKFVDHLRSLYSQYDFNEFKSENETNDAVLKPILRRLPVHLQ